MEKTSSGVAAAIAALAVGLSTSAGWAMSPPGAPADPFADEVIEFIAGSGGSASFADPGAALGEPTRFTAPASSFGGAVTPFNAAFGAGEFVSIGQGGSLTVRFAEPVRNDALNPFGIDLLIFGNPFFFLSSFPDGVAAGLFAEGGVIELSADGVNFVTVTGLAADGGFPTLGFSDLTDPFSPTAGLVETDFTRPVDPGFDPIGLAFAEIVAGYAGSGGGLGVDIGALGFEAISFVRITNPLGSGVTPEIDGFADVRAIPGPGALVALAGVGGLLARGRERGRRRA